MRIRRWSKGAVGASGELSDDCTCVLGHLRGFSPLRSDGSAEDRTLQHLEDGIYNEWIELLACSESQLPNSFRERPRISGICWLNHTRKGIGDAQYPSAKGNLAALEAPSVAASVIVLMMGSYHLHQ